MDNDGVCDVVDSCLGDALNDEDADGICDGVDSCPEDSLSDADADGTCDLQVSVIRGSIPCVIVSHVV